MFRALGSFLHRQPAFFETRPSFAVALLRMRYIVDGLKNFPHPERERSEQSKDARQPIQPRSEPGYAAFARGWNAQPSDRPLRAMNSGKASSALAF